MMLADIIKTRQIKNVAATMTIENMFASNAFLRELLKTTTGEKTTEQLRQEIIKKYAR